MPRSAVRARRYAASSSAHAAARHCRNDGAFKLYGPPSHPIPPPEAIKEEQPSSI